MLTLIYNSPEEVTKIEVEAVYKSSSTLILITMPPDIWAGLLDHPACSLVGFVKPGNILAQQRLEEVAAAAMAERRLTERLGEGKEGKEAKGKRREARTT
jgi:hypothetical protein